MLNFFAKALLASTSLSPVLVAVGINLFECGEPLTVWVWWFLLALLLAFLCWGLLELVAKKDLPRGSLIIEGIQRKDQETLTFLFLYLLPFLRSDCSILVNTGWPTIIYVLGIIIFAIAYNGSFHFNPVMRFFFKYHFYSVHNSCGESILLISKTELRHVGVKIQTVSLSSNVHLNVEQSNV